MITTCSKYLSLKKVFFLPAIIAFCLSCAGTVHAQKTIEQKKENKTHKRKIEKRHQKDSVWEKDLNITDSSSAIAISRIQDMNTTLNDFNDVVDQGYDSSDISENLPQYERRIHYYKISFANLNSNLNLSRLAGIQGNLDDMSDDLKDWQTSLLAYYTELVGMNAQMRSILLDSGIESLPKDTTLRILYVRQLNELKERLHATDTVTKKNLLKVDQLQSKVSNDYLDVIALQKQIKSLVKAYRKKAFTKEGAYLWEGSSSDTSTRTLDQILQRTLKANRNVLDNYLSNNWDKYLFGIPIFLIFFFWSYLNIKKIKSNNPSFLAGLIYIQTIPLLASLVITLIILPYFDLTHPPSVYLLNIQLLLVITLSFLLAKKWPKQLFFFWPLFAIAFLFFGIKMLMSNSTYYIRLVTFFVTVSSIILGIAFSKRVKKYKDFFPGLFWLYNGHIYLPEYCCCMLQSLRQSHIGSHF